MVRSDFLLIMVESVAVLFAKLASPPPATFTLFTNGVVARLATFTVNVIGG